MLAPFLLAFAVNHAGSLWGVKVLELAPVRWLGLISYSVYLWQQPFYRLHLPYKSGLVLSLIVGTASFYFFESPIRRWLNANWHGQGLDPSRSESSLEAPRTVSTGASSNSPPPPR